MAELTTLARPYAKAAFIVARDSKKLSAWDDALNVAATVSLDEKVQALLSSPNLTAQQKGDQLCVVCGDVLSSNQQNFLHVLAQNQRLGLLPEIYSLFENLKAQHEKVLDVSVDSAFAIDTQLEQQLIDALSKKLDRDVTLQTSVDESLLGGVLIRAGDTVIDGSVRGRLAKLADTLDV